MRTGPAAALFVVLFLSVSIDRSHAQSEVALDYGRLIALGIAEFEAERWGEARAYFERAHALEPNARTLRGIGFAAFELGEYVVAIQTLDQSLADLRRPLTDAQRREVTELRDRASTLVGRLSISVDPHDASVRVDAPVAILDDGTRLIDPGSYEVLLRAPGFEPESRRITIVAGRTTTVSVTLRALDAPENAALGRAGPAASSRPTAGSDRGRTRRVLGWSLVGAAGALGVTSLGTGVRGKAIHDALLVRCPDGVCATSDAASITRGTRLVHASTATTFLSAAAAISGALVLLVGGRDRDVDAPPVPRVIVGPGTAGLGLERRF